jgi:alcohol dehydrogenase
MHAVVYHGPGTPSWDEVPDPNVVDDRDAIVRVDAVTICGTDLHILRGDVPTVADGRVLGHEAVGTVEAVGSQVTTVEPGDRVLVSCISAFGRCYEVGVLNGRVVPGDVVAVVGAGPIGLAAMAGAQLLSPARIVAIDLADGRLEAAKQFGADVGINNGREDAVARIREVSDGAGADVAIEAVGVPESFELCTSLIRPTGRVANVGVHGRPARLDLDELWSRDITVTTGLVDTYSTPTLMRLLTSSRLDASRFVTHHLTFDRFMEAYEVFTQSAQTKALKVVLTPDGAA